MIFNPFDSYLGNRRMPAVRGPEWLYVTTSFPDTHGNYEITCKFCSTVFRGKASRIREHLLKCAGVPSDVRQSIKDIDTKKSDINSTRTVRSKTFQHQTANNPQRNSWKKQKR